MFFRKQKIEISNLISKSFWGTLAFLLWFSFLVQADDNSEIDLIESEVELIAEEDREEGIGEENSKKDNQNIKEKGEDETEENEDFEKDEKDEKDNGNKDDDENFKPFGSVPEIKPFKNQTVEKVSEKNNQEEKNLQKVEMFQADDFNIKNERDVLIEKFKKVYINEIFPDPSNEDYNQENCLIDGKNLCEEEWIELYNSGEENLELAGYTLADKNLFKDNCEEIRKKYESDESTDLKGCSLKGAELFSEQTCEKIKDKFAFGENDILLKNGFKVIKKSDFKFTLNNKNEDVYLLSDKCLEIKKVSYGNKGDKNLSYAFDLRGGWKWTKFLTPMKENQFPEPKTYSRKLEMTELMPNPDGVDNGKEWLEILNKDDVDIDLSEWYLLTQSNEKPEINKGEDFGLDGLIINAGQRLKVEILKGSFLRNGNSWICLMNPNGEIVDKVEYLESAKVNVSYSRKLDKKWEWSIFATPGAENRFNNPPSYKVKIPDEIYKDVKTKFEIFDVKDKDGETLKYRWQFSTGKRSYIPITTQTFDKKGKYTVEVRVSDRSIDVFKAFKFRVESFPEFDLKIVKLLPNPAGSDSENEKIWIKNNEKKRINLKGWIIATGEDSESLVNHYIKDDFKIEAGDIKSIERDDCAFSLLNKKARIVLESPNGEIVDKVEYEKEKIEEDEIYLYQDDRWVWVLPDLPINNKNEIQILGSKKIEPLRPNFFQIRNKILLDENQKRSVSFKLICFNNWLYSQNEKPFSKIIFPKNFLERF